VSSTIIPDNQQKSRNYGITSITTNTNSSRIFALSRDSTVYAYSTQHLVLGSVPEMMPGPDTTHRYSTENQKGLAPIYGLRHPDLIISSFYIKSALRRAQYDKPELLATGSVDGNVFVFPTDEREIRNSRIKPAPIIDPSTATPMVDMNSRTSTPIYTAGTKLAHGHNARQEVSHVTWAHGGELISCGDDYRTRIWRENAELAKYTRKHGHILGVQNHLSGYADVRSDEDDDVNTNIDHHDDDDDDDDD
jgi:hypothetical protein